jgi:hypothetical protein
MYVCVMDAWYTGVCSSPVHVSTKTSLEWVMSRFGFVWVVAAGSSGRLSILLPPWVHRVMAERMEHQVNGNAANRLVMCVLLIHFFLYLGCLSCNSIKGIAGCHPGALRDPSQGICPRAAAHQHGAEQAASVVEERGAGAKKSIVVCPVCAVYVYPPSLCYCET